MSYFDFICFTPIFRDQSLLESGQESVALMCSEEIGNDYKPIGVIKYRDIKQGNNAYLTSALYIVVMVRLSDILRL